MRQELGKLQYSFVHNEEHTHIMYEYRYNIIVRVCTVHTTVTKLILYILINYIL